MSLLAIAILSAWKRCNALEAWGYRDSSDYVRRLCALLRGR